MPTKRRLTNARRQPHILLRTRVGLISCSLAYQTLRLRSTRTFWRWEYASVTSAIVAISVSRTSVWVGLSGYPCDPPARMRSFNKGRNKQARRRDSNRTLKVTCRTRHKANELHFHGSIPLQSETPGGNPVYLRAAWGPLSDDVGGAISDSCCRIMRTTLKD